MPKTALDKPTLFLLYGFPGSGKTHFSRQLCETIQAVHIQSDKIRFELFETPRYDKQENEVVLHLMRYMAEEFLQAGISVVFDVNAARLSQRRALRDLARKAHATPVLLWLQIDPEHAYVRLNHRDRRKTDDRYAERYNRATFEQQMVYMQNPDNEEYIVLSGKHTYNSQKSAVMKKLHDYNLLGAAVAQANLVKPGLVNLVPNPTAGRVDESRRNIVIR